MVDERGFANTALVIAKCDRLHEAGRSVASTAEGENSKSGGGFPFSAQRRFTKGVITILQKLLIAAAGLRGPWAATFAKEVVPKIIKAADQITEVLGEAEISIS